MKNKKVSSLSVMTYFFKIAFKTRPSYPILILLTILINAVQPFLSIIFPTLIIEELTKVTTDNFNLSYIILLVATFTLSEFTLSALRSIMWHFMSYNENMVNKEWKKIMGDKMMKMRYQHLENPEVLDQISKGQDGLQESLTLCAVMPISSHVWILRSGSVDMTARRQKPCWRI